MAANKSVIVLVPNGRRQTVKVTPNTTILQILEEVCQKHGYHVDDYDIKHFKNVLDPNAILRFTGLSNNAQLEMVPCTKARSVSNVVIGIQLESGERLIGAFTPDTTLIEVLQRNCPDQDLEKAILIYMHREVYGIDALKKTTLKSLGLNSGRAILRLIYRDPETLKTQAHVSAPLTKPLKDSTNATANTSNNNSGCGASSTLHTNNVVDPLSLLKSEKAKAVGLKTSENVNTEHKVKPEKDASGKDNVHKEDRSSITKDSDGNEDKKNSAELCRENEEPENNIEFLGDRYGLVFNQAGVQAVPRDELPDHFYDITIDDAKVLLRDAKRRREELEEAPLLTDAQRQLNQEKQMLSQLHKYRRTIIRIQFPDQFVLQALFGPLETIKTIKDFIKEYLVDPDSDFEIYTTPPKYVLKPDARLIDENLVPCAILHYSGPSALKPEIKDKQIDPKDASIQAIKARIQITRQDDEDNSSEANTGSTSAKPNCSASGSSDQNQNNPTKLFKRQ